jgi:8-oxo-dGTP pyrophosphatase MutT (NUDIX family)
MAGIIFTDGKLVLAGYNSKHLFISGIGGKIKENETPIITAVRETVEELFELEEIPGTLFDRLYEKLTFDRLFFKSEYTTFIMTFNDLKSIFKVLGEFDLKSRVYDKIPTSLEELLMTRKGGELSHILLIPCVDNIVLDKLFIGDIQTFKNCERSIR